MTGSPEFAPAAELFKALGSPARLAILSHLMEHDACVHELVASTGASQSLVSQHLRVLRAARLVTGTRAGKEVRYALMDDHIAHVIADAIAHVREPRHRADTGDTESPGDTHQTSTEQHGKAS